MRRPVCIAALAWLALATPAFARIEVHVAGAVAHPGTLTLPDSARLSDAALGAGVRPDAYLLGAAWLRPSRMRNQIALKAGILYDLGALERAALGDGDAALVRTVRDLHAWIAKLPVTGREAALLAPRVVEATAAANLPIAAGDTLFYPLRPGGVRVVGAVQAGCTLPLRALQSARAYVDHCALAAGADRDWVWVIQPDGRSYRQGVALWNLSGALPLAPGAVIYVPLARHVADRIDPALNHDVAAFLATQTLPGRAP